MRILTVDLESSPHLAYTFQLRDVSIAPVQVVEPSRVLCFAAKWLDKPGMIFASEHHDGREAMVQRIWQLLDEADVVVGWNTKSFDLKHFAREFTLAGLPPPSPWFDCDLLPLVRRRMRWASNKLEHVADELGIGRKVQHHGFRMWIDCLNGDDAAWTLFRKYCKHDVRLTEDVFVKLRELGWVDRLPHVGLYNDTHGSQCGACGSTDLMRRGYAYTSTSRYAQFQCKDCKRYSRASHADRRQYVRPV